MKMRAISALTWDGKVYHSLNELVFSMLDYKMMLDRNSICVDSESLQAFDFNLVTSLLSV